MRVVTVVDATTIAVPSSTKNRATARVPVGIYSTSAWRGTSPRMRYWGW